ncbi:MAG: TatD family hydrolase [Actinomycetes bacterium]
MRGAPDGYPPLPEPLPLPVVDNHTHLDIPAALREAGPGQRFPSREDVERLLAAAAEVGVTRAVQIGCDLPSARWTVEALDDHPRLLGGVAIHPNEAPRLATAGVLDDALTEIERLAAHPRVRVVGETGLDWFRTDGDDDGARTAQLDSFRAHVEMAKRLDLALQIHDRDAHDDVLRVLEEEGAPERTVFHCFSGDAAMARRCVESGWYLSFAGTVTFRNATALRNALAAVGLGQVLVETDAPYLTPVPYRGRPNAGHLVPHTVRAMAEVLGADVERVCEAIDRTSEVVYGEW